MYVHVPFTLPLQHPGPCSTRTSRLSTPGSTSYRFNAAGRPPGTYTLACGSTQCSSGRMSVTVTVLQSASCVITPSPSPLVASSSPSPSPSPAVVSPVASPSPGVPGGNSSWPGLDSDESWLPADGVLAPDGPTVFRKPLLRQDAYTVDYTGRLSISGGRHTAASSCSCAGQACKSRGALLRAQMWLRSTALASAAACCVTAVCCRLHHSAHTTLQRTHATQYVFVHGPDVAQQIPCLRDVSPLRLRCFVPAGALGLLSNDNLDPLCNVTVSLAGGPYPVQDLSPGDGFGWEELSVGPDGSSNVSKSAYFGQKKFYYSVVVSAIPYSLPCSC